MTHSIGESDSVVTGKPELQPLGKLRHRVGAFAHDLAARVEQSLRVNVPGQATPRAAVKEASLEERLEQEPQAERVFCRHEVDRAAHQSRPDSAPGLHQPGELFGSKALESRPQPDIRKVGRLGLHPHETLDRRGGGELDRAKQHLARQQGAIQRARAEDLGGSSHGPIVGFGPAAPRRIRLLADPCPSCASN